MAGVGFPDPCPFDEPSLHDPTRPGTARVDTTRSGPRGRGLARASRRWIQLRPDLGRGPRCSSTRPRPWSPTPSSPGASGRSWRIVGLSYLLSFGLGAWAGGEDPEDAATGLIDVVIDQAEAATRSADLIEQHALPTLNSVDSPWPWRSSQPRRPRLRLCRSRLSPPRLETRSLARLRPSPAALIADGRWAAGRPAGRVVSSATTPGPRRASAPGRTRRRPTPRCQRPPRPDRRREGVQ